MSSDKPKLRDKPMNSLLKRKPKTGSKGAIPINTITHHTSPEPYAASSDSFGASIAKSRAIREKLEHVSNQQQQGSPASSQSPDVSRTGLYNGSRSTSLIGGSRVLGLLQDIRNIKESINKKKKEQQSQDILDQTRSSVSPGPKEPKEPKEPEKPQIVDISGTPVDVEQEELHLMPAISLPLTSITYNDNFMPGGTRKGFMFHVSHNGKLLYFTTFGEIINHLVVKLDDYYRDFIFAEYLFLIRLNKGMGFILGKHGGRDDSLRTYFTDHTYWQVNANLNADKAQLETIAKGYRKSNTMLDDISLHSFSSGSPFPTVKKIAPKKIKSPSSSSVVHLEQLEELNDDHLGMYDFGRSTRSRTKFFEDISNEEGSSYEPISIVEERVETAEDPEFTDQFAVEELVLTPREVPIDFSPDLHHKFGSKRMFTIGFNDFKTLYNNDWINDSVIDFFIEYEIDQVTRVQSLIDSNDIYAFNSFFFTKLMTRQDPEVEPDYYANVKRWVSKLDLKKYPYIVLPVNENAHWYCCIIRGLPELKEISDADARNELSTSESTRETESHEEAATKQLRNIQVKDSQEDSRQFSDDDDIDSDEEDTSKDMDYGPKITIVGSSEALDVTEQSPLPKTAKNSVDIFIVDSLGQRHGNIHLPLKKFVIDYCKDKHNLEISKRQIRVLMAHVPKQNNFNDCGIHVIYNIRKWLHNIPLCEKIWRGSVFSKKVMKKVFVADERNDMRKELKNKLIELHKIQEENRNDTKVEDDSDGDIEVIEHDSNSPSKTPTNELPPTKSPPIKAPPTKSPPTHLPPSNFSDNTKLPFLSRTLDPKAQKFTNDTLNRKFGSIELKDYTMLVLNGLFNNKHFDLSSEMLHMIRSFAIDIDSFEKGDARIKGIVNTFEKSFFELKTKQENSTRPKDQPFKIEHDKVDDSPEFSFMESPGKFEEIVDAKEKSNSPFLNGEDQKFIGPQQFTNGDLEFIIKDNPRRSEDESSQTKSLDSDLDVNMVEAPIEISSESQKPTRELESRESDVVEILQSTPTKVSDGLQLDMDIDGKRSLEVVPEPERVPSIEKSDSSNVEEITQKETPETIQLKANPEPPKVVSTMDIDEKIKRSPTPLSKPLDSVNELDLQEIAQPKKESTEPLEKRSDSSDIEEIIPKRRRFGVYANLQKASSKVIRDNDKLDTAKPPVSSDRQKESPVKIDLDIEEIVSKKTPEPDNHKQKNSNPDNSVDMAQESSHNSASSDLSNVSDAQLDLDIEEIIEPRNFLHNSKKDSRSGHDKEIEETRTRRTRFGVLSERANAKELLARKSPRLRDSSIIDQKKTRSGTSSFKSNLEQEDTEKSPVTDGKGSLIRSSIFEQDPDIVEIVGKSPKRTIKPQNFFSDQRSTKPFIYGRDNDVVEVEVENTNGTSKEDTEEVIFNSSDEINESVDGVSHLHIDNRDDSSSSSSSIQETAPPTNQFMKNFSSLNSRTPSPQPKPTTRSASFKKKKDPVKQLNFNTGISAYESVNRFRSRASRNSPSPVEIASSSKPGASKRRKL